MVLIFLLATSAILQFGAAYVAFRLTRLTSARKALVAIAIAMSLMAIPRLITLSRIILNSPDVIPDLTIEVVVFAISALMVVALIEIGPHIQPSNLATLALQDSEQKFRKLSEAAFEGVVVSENGKFVEVSPQYAKLFGYRTKELLGRSASDLMAPEIRDESLGKLLSGYDQAYESVGMRKDGTTFPLEVCGKNFRSQGREFRVAAVRDITERKRAEEALKESEQKFRTLAEQSPNMIFINKMGVVVYANKKCEELMGYKKEELYSPVFDFMTLIAPESTDLVQANFNQHMQGEDVPPYEYALITKEGKRVEVLITTKLIYYEDGNAILGIVTDITERKQMEEALRESESRYRSLFEESAISLWEEDWSQVKNYFDEMRASGVTDFRAHFDEHPQAITDCMDRIKLLDVNKATMELHDTKDKQELLASLSQVLPKQALDAFKDELIAVAEGCNDFKYETVHKTLAGDNKRVLLHLHIPPGYEESLAKVYVSMLDISELKQAMGEIERLKEFTEGILQSMSEGVVVDDSQGYFRFVNQAAAKLLGYEPEELVGQHWTNSIPSDQHNIIHAANERRGRGEADRYEIELKRKNGTRFPVLISGSPRFVEGELRGTMAVFTDVTTRKQREREQGAIVAVATALRLASRREDMLPIILDQLLNLLDAEAAALVMRDPDTGESIAELGRGIWADWTGERLPPGKGVSGHVIESGEFYSTNDVHRDSLFARHDLLGDVVALICAPLIAYEETIGALLVGRRQGFEEGEIQILSAIADMAANALYRTNLMETLERRVLKRTRELEEANERLMELDQLKSDFVSNVSHELRTPITNIMLYLNLLDRQTKREEHSRYMQILRAESTRLANLIEDLLTLSRLEQGRITLDLEPHVLDALIAETLTAHQARAKDKSIGLHHEPNPEVPPVFISRDQMVQVFTNMVSNAIAYTHNGGQVTMSSDLTEVEGEQHVIIRIHNDAPAIPPEDLPHIFERFYRGKVGRESGESGTGLGLSICKEIVEIHRGRIEVTSNEIEGTTFTICLPVTHPQA